LALVQKLIITANVCFGGLDILLQISGYIVKRGDLFHTRSPLFLHVAKRQRQSYADKDKGYFANCVPQVCVSAANSD
jgi:hypothetical protein